MAHLEEILAIMPSLLLGSFSGLASYFNNYIEDMTNPPSIIMALTNMMSSSIIAFCCFAVLTEFTTWAFMTKLAVSSTVAFFGIDKALGIIEKLNDIRKGGGNNAS